MRLRTVQACCLCGAAKNEGSLQRLHRGCTTAAPPGASAQPFDCPCIPVQKRRDIQSLGIKGPLNRIQGQSCTNDCVCASGRGKKGACNTGTTLEPTDSLDTERRGRRIKQQFILAAFAAQDASLHSGAMGHCLMWVDAAVRLLAMKEVLDQLLNLGDAR